MQNELTERLPSSFTTQFPKGTGIAFSIIPAIKDLEDPFKTEVQEAFADSIRIIWLVTTAVAALGFFVSLTMQSLPLSNTLDEQWGLEERDTDTFDDSRLA